MKLSFVNSKCLKCNTGPTHFAFGGRSNIITENNLFSFRWSPKVTGSIEMVYSKLLFHREMKYAKSYNGMAVFSSCPVSTTIKNKIISVINHHKLSANQFQYFCSCTSRIWIVKL